MPGDRIMLLSLSGQGHSTASAPRTAWLIGVAGLLASLIFVIDALTPLDIAIAVLYVVVILLIALTGNRRLTILAGVICVLLTVTGYLLPHSALYNAQATARSMIGLLAIVTTLFLSLRNLSNTAIVLEKAKLLELSHDAMIMHDLDGRITAWNRGAERLYGVTEKGAMGASIHSLLATRFPEPLESIRNTVLEGGHWEGQLVQRCADQHWVSVESRWSLWRDQRGRPAAILMTSNNVTERIQAEADLARSETFLAEAQLLSRTGSIAIRLAAREVWCSAEARRILNVTGNEPVTLAGIVALIHPDDARRLAPAYLGIRKRADVVDAECRLRLRDGQEKFVRFVAHRQPIDGLSMQHGSGTSTTDVEYVGALMDVTEARLTQQALHQSMRDLAHVARLSTLGELAASIAHEVKQPIAAVITSGSAALRWLKRPVPEFGEANLAIENMIRDAQRASEVVSRVRALAQKRDVHRQAVDINTIVSESAELIGRELETSGVRLSLDLSGQLPFVTIDRVQIQQVVMNLLMNGVQSMERVEYHLKRLVVSSALNEKGHVCIEVLDRGVGIDRDVQTQIFSPFFTTKSDGMGMGLVIARSIIESHGGEIRIESREDGGTSAWFTLPME
jgi:PAS domain S-box-containing protein